ncbi:MAG: hypothetical protein ACJ75B_11630 [Flavisolibacter sp.]
MRTCFFLLIFLQAHADTRAQSSAPERASFDPGTYYPTSHHTVRSISGADNKKANQMMDAVVEVFKNAYPQPIGADVGPYGGIRENYRGPSEVQGGPYAVYLTLPFYEHYKTKTGATEANGEYESSLAIWINQVRYILQANPVSSGNDRVFRLPRPGIAVNGFPKFNNMILILAPGSALPWRPATKEEYLQNFIEEKRNNVPGSFEKQQIESAQQLLASLSASQKKEIAYLKKKNILFAEFGYAKWEGFRDASDTNAEQLVTINENFYDRSLPRTSYQVIVIERKQGRSSYSAAAPTRQELEGLKARTDRLNHIVRNTNLLGSLQQMLGKNGSMIAGNQKKTTPSPPFSVKPLDRTYINHIVDSVFKNHTIALPSVPSGAGSLPSALPPPFSIPASSSKKLQLAARRLNTREELVQYLDELDQKISAQLGSTKMYNTASENNSASYGYWLMDQPGQSLILAIKAAKQRPDDNCLLNNLGSNLSVCGIDYMAIPLYIVCLKKEPDNSTITNNIGQSWLALGDQVQAENYLKKAVASSPYHHHANNTLGLIYESQGRKNEAIQCYENSLRGSFTLEGYNGLRRLKPELTLKLMDYVRHRYHQPDYLNFDKFQVPAQCMRAEETEIRKNQHEVYQKMLDAAHQKMQKLRDAQYALADKESKQVIIKGQQGKVGVKPFLPFAGAMMIAVQKEFESALPRLQKELLELEKQKLALKMEYDTVMKMTLAAFEERLDKLGEGNSDPTLDEDICAAKNGVVNHYLPLFADNNELRFTKILHAYRDYLNDYLYWVRLGSWGEEEYKLEYYKVSLMMIEVLEKLQLTTLHEACNMDEIQQAKAEELKLKQPDCPLPVGVEIPLVVGKISFDCVSWGLELGEGIVVNIDHKFGGESTIALGVGESFYTTSKISNSVNPGLDVNAKGQLFFTFEGSTLMDGGFLWEAEIDLKGIGKPAELKQNFTWAIVKGYTAEGQLSSLADKIFDIPPEQQVNKKVKIFKPSN